MSSAPIIVHSLHPEASENSADAASCWSSVSLWTPHRIEPSGWLRHAPFAFWLTQAARPRSLVELGVHSGFSYLAFCQAVHELGLNTTCYGVDTWHGDEHAGFYGPEILAGLKDYHDSRYAGFSQLIQSTFADALDCFDERSIDLLHIDGRHFYEDVREDFEAWQPKLSKSAIVLLHDTNVREREFGVWRFWQELASDYPSFEFKHGHGLGVLAVGKEIPALLRPLFFGSETSREKVRQFYARLGSAIAERAELGSAREGISLRDSELTVLRGEVKARAEAFRELESEIDRLRSKVAAEQAPLASECNRLRAELGRKVTEILDLRAELDRGDRSAAALQGRMGAMNQEFARKVDEIGALKTELAASGIRIAALREDVAREARVLSSAQAELATRQDRIRALETEAARRDSKLSALKDEIEALKACNAALECEVAGRDEDANATKEEMSDALSRLNAQIEARDTRIAVVETEFARKVEEVAGLHAEIRNNERQTEHLLEAHRVAKERAMAVSVGEVGSRDQQIAVLRVEMEEQREQTRQHIADIEARFLAEKAEANATLEQRLAETQKRLSAMEASTSWRLTSPLRSAVFGMRGLARSLKQLPRLLRR